MFVNAIIKVKTFGEPWRMHLAWMDPATGVPDGRSVWWIYAPSVCRESWLTDDTLTLDGEIVFHEVVESWAEAEDSNFSVWKADEHHEVGLCPRFGGMELSLQDRDGFSWLTISPEQALGMAEYLTRWAKGAVNA